MTEAPAPGQTYPSAPIEIIAAQVRQGADVHLDSIQQATNHITQAATLVAEVTANTPGTPLLEAELDVAYAGTHANAAAIKLANGKQDLDAYANIITGGTVEQATYAPVIPVERTYGSTRYTVALSTHNNQTIQEMAQTVTDCDALAIECVGGMNTEQRTQLQYLYNLMLTPGLDPVVVQQQFDMLKQGDPSVIPRILEQFIGTGKKVYLIDMANDHPDYEKIAKRAQSMQHLGKMISALAPVQSVRQVLAATINETAEANTERNWLLGYQLQWLDSQLEPGNRVGVVMGKEHYDVLNMLDPTASDETQEIQERLSQTDTPWVQAIVARMETGEIPPPAVDRVALGLYIGTYSDAGFSSEETLANMTDEQVSNVLGAIQHATNASAPHQNIRDAVSVYCTGVSQRFTLQA